ncbi:MAG: HAMP domain-containing protein [Firmicutes bacterium]|nr:HAMP domain-containing protein [Bacillota bacterium]
MGIRTKLFVLIIIGVFAMLLTVIVFLLFNQYRLFQAMITDSLTAAEGIVASELDGRAQQALGISMAVAGMPEIIEGAISQERRAIVDTVVSIYESVHHAFGVDVLHVRAPYDTSLVRGQNPEVYGDVQSRGGIVDAARLGQPLYGFDRGPFGMGMRGWAPIKAGNTVVGTVETNIPFTENLLRGIHESVNAEIAVFVPSNGGYELLTATAGTAQVPVLNDITFDFTDTRHLTWNWAYSYFPVVSYDGTELAVVTIFQDIAEYQRMILTQTLQLIVVLVVGAIGFTGLLLYLVGRILTPLQMVGRAAETIASGDLTVVVPSVESRDEVGMLVGAFTKMVGSLKQMIGSVSETVNEISSASQQLASSTEQSRSSIRQVSDTADDFDSAAAAMRDITAAIDGIASVAEQGNTAVQQAVQGTAELQETMGRLTDFITILEQRSEEIGRIVEMINAVAEQTNLLALNAAIEAARAGEEGRGFAVVAEEVRKLAERSADATEEITQLINAIQQETQEAVAGMSQSSAQVEKTSEIVSQSGEALHRIIAAVNGVTDLIGSASRSIAQINSASQEITAAAEEQFTTMDEIAETSQELRQMAAKLQELSSQFKV